MLRGLMRLNRQSRPDFRIIRGVSAGALNGAIVAEASATTGDPIQNFTNKVEKLERLWRDVFRTRGDVYGWAGGTGPGRHSIYTLWRLAFDDRLWEQIQKYVKPDEIRNSGRDYTCGAVDYVSGEYRQYGANSPDFLSELLASACIPIVFEFVPFRPSGGPGRILFDGGVRNVTPLVGLLEEHPEITDVYVLLTTEYDATSSSNVAPKDYGDWAQARGNTIVKTALRTVDIMMDEIFINDLAICRRWNAIVAAMVGVEEAVGRHDPKPDEVTTAVDRLKASFGRAYNRHVNVNVLAPKEPYGTDNSGLDFNVNDIDRAIRHGEEIGSNPDEWTPI